MKSDMRPIKETIPLEEARQLIADACRPIDRTERVRLVDANGRVAAANVQSTRDVPPFARAGMDGFALRAEDTFGASRYEPKTLRVIDKVYTGEVPTKSIEPGTAIEIATGAPMPQGADAVVMVEETEKAGGDVRVLTPVYPRQNVGRQGADIVVGQTVIGRGDVLNPSRIGALAALGVGDVEVFAKPTVAILSTGNEIADPGQELRPGQIYDINKFTLSTIIGRPMFGMPGYPTSCLSNAYMLLVPALRSMARLKPRHTATMSLPLGQRIVSTTGRHQFYTVKIVEGQAMPAFKASGDITSMSQADGYIEIPAQTDMVEKGEVVDVKLF